MGTVSDDQLREMARLRGFRLVKSRKRTPGLGDYGKYGLTDAAGKALLGIKEGGLTASAADIQAYLRNSAMKTWRQSTETMPEPSARPKQPLPLPPNDDDAPVRRRTGQAVTTRRAPLAAPAFDRQRKKGEARQKPDLKLVPKAEPEPDRKHSIVPEAVLHIRTATATDAVALAALLSQFGGLSVEPTQISENLAIVRKAKAGTVVGELNGIVGCCSWAVIPTLHRGLVGRLTALVVDAGHRRHGVATAMLSAVEQVLAKAGCRQIEAMSDIAINNSHGFFRSRNFEQTSYRFMRAIEE